MSRGRGFNVAFVSVVAAAVWSVAVVSHAQEGGYIGLPPAADGVPGGGGAVPGGGGAVPDGYTGLPGGYTGVPRGGGGVDVPGGGGAAGQASPPAQGGPNQRFQDAPGGSAPKFPGVELLQFAFIAAGFAALYLMVAHRVRTR